MLVLPLIIASQNDPLQLLGDPLLLVEDPLLLDLLVAISSIALTLRKNILLQY
ncbi:uncharacterized protein RSE6_09156 [Rhynchosporium secalis]|uniref:Uncharacterized protein n=1 Tax=Rhynchosporium secalis TaxID=38038 RepID=A0A1E1MH88_RHYSE|nr:uncharacterized protein RSE6_09156 [Rhynchosporium secalis]